MTQVDMFSNLLTEQQVDLIPDGKLITATWRNESYYGLSVEGVNVYASTNFFTLFGDNVVKIIESIKQISDVYTVSLKMLKKQGKIRVIRMT